MFSTQEDWFFIHCEKKGKEDICIILDEACCIRRPSPFVTMKYWSRNCEKDGNLKIGLIIILL